MKYDAVATREDPQGSSMGGAPQQQQAPTASPRSLYLLQLALVCSCWLAASSGIIILNRYIMKELAFSFPMALSAMGQAVSFSFSWFLCDVLKAVPAADIDMRFFLTRIAPVGAAQGVAMWLSNNLYLLLTVAFIEMARSSLPLVTLLGLWAVRVEIPTWEHIQAVSLTGLGCAISAFGEVALTALGLLCLASNFALEVTRMVMLQFLMQGQNLNPWQGLKLMTLPATCMLVLMALIMELKAMREADALGIVLSHPLEFIAATTLGLCVNFLSNLIIKMSSATTAKLLAAVRGPVVVLCGMLLFSETVTPGQFFGYSIALTGFVWFNIAKARTPPKGALQNLQK